MKLNYDRKEQVFHAAGVVLGEPQPVINGIAQTDWHMESGESLPASENAERARLCWYSPKNEVCKFTLEIEKDEVKQRYWLRYWIEGWQDPDSLDDFGIRFARVKGAHTYLKNGYHSWDGSYYRSMKKLSTTAVDKENDQRGFGMIQFLTEQGSVLLGFDRHDRFQQTFTLEGDSQGNSLTVLTLWDRKKNDPALRCESERLTLLVNSQTEAARREWAQIIADASPIGVRQQRERITGWCSWYNLYATINQENIREHLHGAREIRDRLALPLRFFQIDDGFTPEMGDWLEVKPQFPHGMKAVLDEIREAGFIPGLWIAPFAVGNRSHLYQEHPDWVIKDRLTGGPLVQMRFYGEFRWHKRSEEYYILDTTHPEAFAYLRRVFATWREEWGCEYFKTDFMFFGSEYGPDRVVRYQEGQTRIEVWCQAAQMMREAMGEAVWLGCGCPLWASVGLVDAVRIGRDMGAAWKGEQSAQSLLRDQETRNFGNNILWQIDPDCVLLRDQFQHLNENEVWGLAIYAGLASGVLMTSDSLHEVSEKNLRLFSFLIQPGKGDCHYPLSGARNLTRAGTENDPVQVQVWRPREGNSDWPSMLFIFNTGELPVDRSYRFEELGLEKKAYLFDVLANDKSRQPIEKIQIRLDTTHGWALFFLNQTPFFKTPEGLL